MKYLVAYMPSFVSTVIYMLQNTEYSVREYLQWFWSAQDFRFIRSGQDVKWTQKAQLLRLIFIVLLVSMYTFGVGLIAYWILADSVTSAFMLTGIGVLILAPIIAVHLLVVPLMLGSIFIQKPREKAAYAQAKQVYEQLDIPVIAIAGSFGKTTTRNLIVTLLSAGMKVATPRNNHNTPIGLSLFAHEIPDDADVVVVELGEYVPGDVAYLAELVQPTIGVVSGINRQHMLRMKTKERTISTIMELADFVDPTKLFINIESEWAAEAARKKYTKFDRTHVGAWKISKSHLSLAGTEFTMKKAGKELALQAPVLGRHQIAPVALAAVIAESLGMSDADIVKGASATAAFERRFEPKALQHNVTMIDDTYNGNPSGLIAGMEFLDELKHDGRKIYATAGIIELGKEAHSVHVELGGRLAATSIKHIIFFDTLLSRVMHDAYLGAGGKGEVTVVENQQDFTRDIEHFVRPNDVILIQNSQREEYFYTQ